MATKIQLRRDTAANWTTHNPTLALGEMGIESDTRKFKFGDGSTAWNGLKYANTDSGKTVKSGLRIAITGDSISSSYAFHTPEIEITADDVGVQLGGWLTTYDNPPITLGGTTYTTADIGKYITFIPTVDDIGKSIGNEFIYNEPDVKIWWEHLRELGVETINGAYASGSMCSHEKTTERLRTSYGWHDQQIRRLGRRIPGTMRREAPDIIIMFRGCNDMSHSPYAKLTSNYFNSLSWQYPSTDEVSGGYGFKEACSIWVKKVRKAYPRARIVFATQNNWKRLNRDKFPVNNGLYTLPQFSEAVREIANFFGCETIDFDKDGITYENMYPTYISDSETIPTHPNNFGHATMAKQAIADLDAKLDLYEFEPLKLEGLVNYQVIANLEDATLSNNNPVYTNDSYTATLTPTVGEFGSVTITMGGVDVTSTAWNSSTNTISIAQVTGDIIVSNTIAPAEVVNITQTLTNVTSSHTGSTIAKDRPANIVLTASAGYAIDTVTVTMDGVDITNSAYVHYANDAEVNIVNVDADITITATATLVNSAYVIQKSIVGQTGKSIDTGTTANGLSTAAVRFEALEPLSNTGFGIYGNIYCGQGRLIETSNPIEFSTGNDTTDKMTGVIVEEGKRYIAKLSSINQDTSYLDMYDGEDFNMTTRLGRQAFRTGTTNNKFWLCGFGSDAVSSSWPDYACTNEKLISAKLWNTSNTLIRNYIPAKRVSDNVYGMYDLVNNTFAPFIDNE